MRNDIAVHTVGNGSDVVDRRAIIDVTTSGQRRRVRILQPQRGTYSNVEEFETAWPQELLYSLAELKGEWFLDSYQRFEQPNYVQKQVDTVLDLYSICLRDALVLDFGCGFGASSYCMLKRGANRIVAADLEKKNIEFAGAFFRANGLASRVDIRHGDVVGGLEPESFGVIWLQAVMEHLLPEERATYLRLFWQALRKDGVLVVTETPNRIWPVEGHTTGGTWWIPWMRPETVFGKMRKNPRYRCYSDVDFYRSGIIGSSYREIVNCLGRPQECAEIALGVSGYVRVLYSRAQKRSGLRLVAVNVMSVADPVCRKVLRRPMTAFMPFLNHLAFKKR
jgi:2-polyprenyl-3-methyl-5-hydroxy-6-metoxy-1,4-benzoquinol methylase